MHWSKLPALHAEIVDKIPKEAFVEPGVPWKFFGESEGANHTTATPTVSVE